MPNLLLSLNKLLCVYPGDIAGSRAEPYMINIFFELDWPYVQDPAMPGNFTGSARVRTSTGPVIGNLGVAKMSAGEVVDIPPAIGREWADISWAIPPENTRSGALGVVSILMEHDAFTEAAVQSIRDQLRSRIQSRLDNLVLTKPQTPPTAPFTPAFTKGDVEAALASELALTPMRLYNMGMSSMSFFENVKAALHPDDLVDAAVFMVSYADVVSQLDRTIELEADLVNPMLKGAFKLYGTVTTI
ncbi:MAG: hypothetical protein HC927_04065 [Deltaproteobacteria bacterium]|nr:hypothetical protein [Deltaproteobacteria bacterium]